MTEPFRRAALALLLLGTLAAASGCGRKNLPVAPGETTPVGMEADPQQRVGQAQSSSTNNPASLQNFQRTNRLSNANGSFSISPAEISTTPGFRKKTFVLDPLLN